MNDQPNLHRRLSGYLDRLKALAPDLNHLRPYWSAYDLDVYKKHHDDSAIKIDALSHRDDEQRGGEDALMEHAYRRDQMAMLRAAILAADTTNMLLLQQLSRREALEVTRLCSTHSGAVADRAWASNLDQHALSGACQLRVFRNQLVQHPGRDILSTAKYMERDSRNVRLNPIYFSTQVDGALHANLESLANNYSTHPAVASIEAHNGQRNFFELIRALHVAIPPLAGANHNPDRLTIDNAVKEYGTDSPTMDEAHSIVEEFFRTVTDAAEAGHLPPQG